MKNIKNVLSGISMLAFVALFGSGCGTMNTKVAHSGWTALNTVPQGAAAYVDGRQVGVTPCSTKLSTRKVPTIQFVKDGYEPYAMQSVSHMNIGGGLGIVGDGVITIFSPPVGAVAFAGDFLDGGFRVQPTEINATLIPLACAPSPAYNNERPALQANNWQQPVQPVIQPPAPVAPIKIPVQVDVHTTMTQSQPPQPKAPCGLTSPFPSGTNPGF